MYAAGPVGPREMQGTDTEVPRTWESANATWEVGDTGLNWGMSPSDLEVCTLPMWG